MFWILLAVAAAVACRAMLNKKQSSSPSGRCATPTLRSQQSGDEGEAIVDAELYAALSWLCGNNFYLHRGALLLNHAPGTAFPTAEVDHLAITPFGIFVVETKNWTGKIQCGPDAQSILRVGADGHQEVRRSPIRQNRSKVGFLRSVLPRVWSVEGIAVFAHPQSEVSSALPANLIRVGDLRQWLRARKLLHEARECTPVNVSHARRAVLAVAETGPDAIRKHRLKVRETSYKLPVAS